MKPANPSAERVLTPEAHEALSFDIEDRLTFVQEDRWIPYPESKPILDEFADLVRCPKKIKMPCRTFVTESHNGKSALARHCQTLHNFAALDRNDPSLPVAFVETPQEASYSKFLGAILSSLATVYRPNAPEEVLEALVLERVAELRVKLMFADEFHGVFEGSGVKTTAIFLAKIKSLLNKIQISFVASGTPAVTRALASDMQFFNRFRQLVLPPWAPNERSRRFLLSLEEWLPFPEPSHLGDRDLGIPLMSGIRVIGDLVARVQLSAELAIKAHATKIELKHVAGALAKLEEQSVTAAL